MREFIGELIRTRGHLQYNFDVEAEIGNGLPPEEIVRFIAEPKPRKATRRLFRALFIGSSGIRIPLWAKAALPSCCSPCSPPPLSVFPGISGRGWMCGLD